MSGLFLARSFGPQTKFQIQVEETVCSAHLSLNCNFIQTHVIFQKSILTPPKINIEPENDGLEDDFPLPGVYSQVPCESSGV